MEGETVSQTYDPQSVGMLLTIVGTRYYTPADELEDFLSDAPRHRMILMAEPNNCADPNAVAVFDIDRAHIVGHVCSEDLPKVHLLMALHTGTIISLRVMGRVPLRHTSLLAYPTIDGKEITELSCAALRRGMNRPDAFATLERSLPTIPAEKKKLIYACLRYLRDFCGCNIPQQTLTAFCRSIERDEGDSRPAPRIDQLITNNPGEVNHE